MTPQPVIPATLQAIQYEEARVLATQLGVEQYVEHFEEPIRRMSIRETRYLLRYLRLSSAGVERVVDRGRNPALP